MSAWITVSILLIFVELSSYLLSILRLISSESPIHAVMVSTIFETFSMLSTSCWFDDSTSCIAVSISRIWLPSLLESSVIFSTFSPVCVTFSRVSWMRRSVSSMDDVIFPEISSRRVRASLIWPEEFLVSVLRVRICSATTAKPFPASPARAASIEALSARRFVWLEMLSIVPVSFLTISNSF